jgi:hypothetical protein
MKKVMVIMECVGPRCVIKCSNKSISGRTEAVNNKGKLISTLASFAELFPRIYPMAK